MADDKQTLSQAGKPKRGEKVPGASSNIAPVPGDAPLYRVKPGYKFFLDKVYRSGEEVRYDGDPGTALERVKVQSKSQDTEKETTRRATRKKKSDDQSDE